MKRQRSTSMARRSNTSPIGAAPYISNCMLDRSACATPGTSSSDCTTVGTKKVWVTRYFAISSTATAAFTSRISTVWPPASIVLEPYPLPPMWNIGMATRFTLFRVMPQKSASLRV